MGKGGRVNYIWGNKFNSIRDIKYLVYMANIVI